jgi:uncharacterized protein
MFLSGDHGSFGPVRLSAELSGRLARSVDELLADGLKDAPGSPVWTSTAWWRFVEADPDHEIAYLVIERHSVPVAVAPVLLIRGPGNLLFYNGPRLLGDFSAIGATQLLEPAETARLADAEPVLDAVRPTLYPSLTVGVFGSHPGLRSFAGDTGPELTSLVPALARLAQELAAHWGCRSHALLYLDPAEDAALSGTGADPGQRTLIGAEGILDVPPGDFDDYLRTLASGRPNRVRRERRSYAEAGITTHVSTGADALTDEYLPLRSALRVKYGHGAGEAWARREFEALRRTVGDELVVFSARTATAVVGYLMAVLRQDVLYTRATGFDYAASAGAYCYFNLVYYDVVRWAQRNGVRRVHYGLGTSEAKHHRGCRLMPRWARLHLPASTPPQVAEVLATQHDSLARALLRLGVDLG